VQAINDTYHTNIVIEDDDIRNSPLDGTYHGKPEEILHIVARTLSVEIIKENDRIILK
jgi:hypothetical protein